MYSCGSWRIKVWPHDSPTQFCMARALPFLLNSPQPPRYILDLRLSSPSNLRFLTPLSFIQHCWTRPPSAKLVSSLYSPLPYLSSTSSSPSRISLFSPHPLQLVRIILKPSQLIKSHLQDNFNLPLHSFFSISSTPFNLIASTRTSLSTVSLLPRRVSSPKDASQVIIHILNRHHHTSSSSSSIISSITSSPLSCLVLVVMTFMSIGIKTPSSLFHPPSSCFHLLSSNQIPCNWL